MIYTCSHNEVLQAPIMTLRSYIELPLSSCCPPFGTPHTEHCPHQVVGVAGPSSRGVDPSKYLPHPHPPILHSYIPVQSTHLQTFYSGEIQYNYTVLADNFGAVVFVVNTEVQILTTNEATSSTTHTHTHTHGHTNTLYHTPRCACATDA